MLAFLLSSAVVAKPSVAKSTGVIVLRGKRVTMLSGCINKFIAIKLRAVASDKAICVQWCRATLPRFLLHQPRLLGE